MRGEIEVNCYKIHIQKMMWYEITFYSTNSKVTAEKLSKKGTIKES